MAGPMQFVASFRGVRIAPALVRERRRAAGREKGGKEWKESREREERNEIRVYTYTHTSDISLVVYRVQWAIVEQTWVYTILSRSVV